GSARWLKGRAAREMKSFLEQALTRETGRVVRVGEIRVPGKRIEARDIRIDDADGASVSIDFLEATPGWLRSALGRRLWLNEVEIRGARIDLPAWVAGYGLSLPAAGSPRELLLERGTLSFSPENHGSRFRLSATTPKGGLIEGEGFVTQQGPSRRMTGSLRLAGLEIEPLLGSIPIPWHKSETARVDGSLSLSGDTDRVSIAAGVDLSGIGVAAESLSPLPVAIEGRLEMDGVWEGGTLKVTKGWMRSSGLDVEWSGTLPFTGASSLAALDMRLRRARCQAVLAAIPESLLGEYSGFVLEGTMDAELHVGLDPRHPENRESTNLEIDVDDRCRFRRVPARANVGRLRRPFVHRVSLANGTTHSFASGPSSPGWTRLSRVSPFLLHAILAQEDRSFFEHRGFVPEAFEMALEKNVAEGRFASGASPISMQLARNLFLEREKTLARKVREIVLTWWLEKSLGKHEILELYVNLVEFGPRVYGVRAAADYYFGRLPDELSPAEAAFLASLLPSPSRYHRSYEQGTLSPSARARVERILHWMAQGNRIDEEALSYGLSELSEGLRFHYGRRPESRHGTDFGMAAPLPGEE
ncbi:MAG TPA: biosynthetic peptidoglycan transglycosylase, partial [Vicinamibacteria bacterium]